MTQEHPAYGSSNDLNKPNSPQCLPYEHPDYRPPTVAELRDALNHGEHWTGSFAAKKLGIKDPRTIRKWISETDQTKIPYSAWRLLLIMKGIVNA